MINPLHKVEVNRYIYHHPRIGDGLAGMLVAQVSDVHMGRWLKPRHMRRLMAHVEAQGPELIAYTGDYVGYDKADLARCVESMSTTLCPTYAVLGNHDHWASTELATSAFDTSPITLLTNERVTLERGGEVMEIVGVDDKVTKHADPDRAFAGVDPTRFCLVLNHVPSLADDLAPRGAHLILSGHTHGFQFNIPRVTHRIAQSLGTEYFAGAYALGDAAYLYINRGLGSASWPRRIRALPELTFFELRPGPAPLLELDRTDWLAVDHGREVS